MSDRASPVKLLFRTAHHHHHRPRGGEVFHRPKTYLGRPPAPPDDAERIVLEIGAEELLLSHGPHSAVEGELRAYAAVPQDASQQAYTHGGAGVYPAQGVLGPIPLESLGKTSTHEHMIVSQVNWFVEPVFDHTLPDASITLETLGRIRRDPVSNKSNLLLDDVDLAIAEVRQFRESGGHTIVDVTNDDFGRDPKKILKIAQETDINVIMGSGFYVDLTHPPDMNDRTLEQCAEAIIRDIREGVHDTGIRSGIIGELGCSGDITPNEEKVLRAAALAQQETGAPISVHQPIPFEKNALKVLDILESEGADVSHVLICHMDHTLDDPDYHKAVAQRGCIVEFDRFGNEWYYDSWGPHWQEWRDIRRVAAIKWLIDAGHGDQITIGQDICYKICLTKYGGWGYGHLLRHVEPMFEELGMDESAARKVLVDNPRRFLAFRKPLPA